MTKHIIRDSGPANRRWRRHEASASLAIIAAAPLVGVYLLYAVMIDMRGLELTVGMLCSGCWILL